MYYKSVQTRLQNARRYKETKKHELVPTTRWTTIAEWVEDEGEYEEGPESLLKLQVTLASVQMNLPVEQVQKFFRLKEDYREDEDYEE
jgi:hypothetical protein